MDTCARDPVAPTLRSGRRFGYGRGLVDAKAVTGSR